MRISLHPHQPTRTSSSHYHQQGVFTPHHPSLNPMPMQLSPPHDHPLPLDHLNQLMSCLSIKTTNNEEVTYVRIPIHPRTLVAWNQTTKTPSLPLRLDSSTHRHHKRNDASRIHPLQLDSSTLAKFLVDPCVKKPIILLIRQPHQLSRQFGDGMVLQELKCPTLIGLRTKSGKIKIQGLKWKKVKIQGLKVHLRLFNIVTYLDKMLVIEREINILMIIQLCILKKMQLIALIIKLSYNNFKI